MRKILIIKMEVYAEYGNDSCILHSEEKQIHTKGKQMKELHVNLEHTANYLIQLFYQTGQKYSCTRTKIGKLMSIIAFVYARNNEKIFDESIYKYNDCGTSINELKLFLDREVYMKDAYADNKEFVKECFDMSTIIPQEYQQTGGLTNQVKTRVEDVFRNFASFSPVDLGQCINPIVNFEGMVNSEEQLDLSKIPNLKREFFDNVCGCDNILNYIFGTNNKNKENIGNNNA